MQALDRAFGLPETAPNQVWGLTVTSARDRTRLVRQILHGEYGPLTAPYRALARYYMHHITPSQHWGISAGLPSGWSVALKNGFFSSSCCAWRIGSTGFISGPGGAGYAVTVMTDGWPSDRPGIEAVEFVARAVALRLASTPFPPFRSADAAVLQQYADVLGARPNLYSRMSLNASLHNDPRRLAPFITLLLEDRRLAFDRPLARLYLGGLLRPPTANGFNHWIALLRTHRIDLRGVAVAFARSDEFAARTAGSHRARTSISCIATRRTTGRRSGPPLLGLPAELGRVAWRRPTGAHVLDEGQRHWRGQPMPSCPTAPCCAGRREAARSLFGRAKAPCPTTAPFALPPSCWPRASTATVSAADPRTETNVLRRRSRFGPLAHEVR